MANATAQRKVYQDFVAGLNTRLSPIRIQPNQEALLNNCVVNDTGILEKAKGFTKDGSPFPNSTDSFIRLLLNLKIGTSVDVLLMAAQDNANTNATYKVDLKKTSGDGTYQYIGHTAPGTASFTNGSAAVVGVGTLWLANLKPGDKIKNAADTDANYTEILTVNNNLSITLTTTYPGTNSVNGTFIARIILSYSAMPRGTVFANKAIITNGVDNPMTYNNTSLDLITDADSDDTDAPRGAYIENHKNRVFMAKSSGFPSRIFWSHVNDEQMWEQDSEEDVAPQENGSIVAIKSFADSLIVFKNTGNSNALYQVVGSFDQDVVGSPDFIRRIDSTENIGIISERSPVVHNGELYFIAQTGLYAIDQRMRVRKVTYDIDSIIRNFNFSLGPQANKAYTFNTNTTWDSGTHSGTIARNQSLNGFFDEFRYTNAKQAPDGCSVFIDSNNDVHVASIQADDNTKLFYIKFKASDNTTLQEQAVQTADVQIDSVSIAVAPNGTVGIAYKTKTVSSFKYYLVEKLSGGSWGTADLAHFPNQAYRVNSTGISLCYKVNSDPRIVVCQSDGTNGTRPAYLKRILSVWSFNDIDTYDAITISMVLDTSDNVYIASTRPENGHIFMYKSIDDGGSFATLCEHTVSGATTTDGASGLAIQFDGTNAYTAVVQRTGAGGDVGKLLLIKQDNTQTTIDASTTCFLRGYAINGTSPVNNFYKLNTTTDKYTFENSNTITDPVSNQGSNTYRTGERSLHANGPVLASITWGANANEIIIRRVAYRSIWLSPIESDAGLTSWGTFVVTGQINGATTLTHEIALRTISPPIAFNTFTSGSLISTDPTLIFIRNRITAVLTTFSTFSIASVVDNYVGTGVDARGIVGTSFLNELFECGSQTGQAANNQTLVQDKFGSFLTLDYPVSCMEVFKARLYAGRSTNGDLLVLQNGYNFSGSSYVAEAQFKEDFLDSIEQDKDLGKIYVLFTVQQTGTLIFSYRLDSFKTPGGSTWVDVSIDQTQDGFIDFLVGQPARSIQCRVKNTGTDEQIGLLGFIIAHGYRDVR